MNKVMTEKMIKNFFWIGNLELAGAKIVERDNGDGTISSWREGGVVDEIAYDHINEKHYLNGVEIPAEEARNFRQNHPMSHYLTSGNCDPRSVVTRQKNPPIPEWIRAVDGGYFEIYDKD